MYPVSNKKVANSDLWWERTREQRQNPSFGLLAVQLWGFFRPGRYCCFIFFGRGAVAGTLITLNTVEVARRQGEETGTQGWAQREAAKERKEIQDVFPFFNDIFCLLSRGSDSSQEKQTPTRTQHDILFLLQRRLTINFIPSPVRIAYFLFLSSHLLSSLSASSLTYPRAPGVIFRGSERTSGLFAGRISGSRHQISRFLGYIKRAAPVPAMQRHKRIRPERYYPGKDVSWEFKAKWKWTWVCRRWLSSIISIEEILF